MEIEIRPKTGYRRNPEVIFGMKALGATQPFAVKRGHRRPMRGHADDKPIWIGLLDCPTCRYVIDSDDNGTRTRGRDDLKQCRLEALVEGIEAKAIAEQFGEAKRFRIPKSRAKQQHVAVQVAEGGRALSH